MAPSNGDVASVLDPDSAADGDALLNRMHRTLWRYAAVCGLVSIGCPEQLRDGPLTVTELASRCGADAPTLTRVLRTAVTTGLLYTAGPGEYGLTEAGKALLDGTESRRLRWNSDPGIWSALGEIGDILRTGQSPFVQRYGGTYGYLATRPETAAVFDRFMTSRSADLAARLAETDVFPATGTVVDVGGGRGTFLAAILRARPALRGILLDLKRVVASAEEYLSANGVGERCEIVVGDFFTAVPPGGSVYLLANVLHNWHDDGATKILRAVRAAIPENGRLLIIETPLPDDDRPHFMKDLDMRILTIEQGGKERLESEYSVLLNNAGFRLTGDSGLIGQSLIVASPVEATR